MSIFYKAKSFFYEQDLKAYLKDERGVTAIEYAVIGVAISSIMLLVFDDTGTFSAALKAAIDKITANLTATTT